MPRRRRSGRTATDSTYPVAQRAAVVEQPALDDGGVADQRALLPYERVYAAERVVPVVVGHLGCEHLVEERPGRGQHAGVQVGRVRDLHPHGSGQALAALRAGSAWLEPPQHSSTKPAILPVSRSGLTRSSTIELASISRPFGKLGGEHVGVGERMHRVARVADHQRRRLERPAHRAVGRGAAEQDPLEHGSARAGVLGDPVEGQARP